ncbi:MAG: hypothetical protein J6T98_08480 [Salinivirgaceae bacterium]|nr:hypothetical protein [Salinivirgaceae bacterium]
MAFFSLSTWEGVEDLDGPFSPFQFLLVVGGKNCQIFPTFESPCTFGVEAVIIDVSFKTRLNKTRI